MVELDLSPRLVVCCIYIPPSYSDQQFDAVLDSLNALPENCDLLLAGYFNEPDIDWDSQIAPSHRSSALCDLFFNKNLVQLISGSTHQMGNILDLTLTNSTDRVSNIGKVPTTMSDHHMLFFNVSAKMCPLHTKVNTYYSRVDWATLDCHLLDVDFSSIDDVNISCDLLTKSISNACN